MQPRFRSLWLAAPALAVAMIAAAPTAQAVSIGFTPSIATVALGDPFTLDVVVSDLAGEIVSAFDLDIAFDPAVLSVSSVSFSNALGDPTALEAFVSWSSAPGLVDLAGVSLLSDAALLAGQGGDAVTLATLGFTKSGAGATSLDFRLDAVNDVKGSGARILGVIATSGAVGAPTGAIPEPAAVLAFAAGLAVVGAGVRRRARADGRPQGSSAISRQPGGAFTGLQRPGMPPGISTT